MNAHDLQNRLAHVRAWLHNLDGRHETMTSFMSALVETQADWADQALVDLLRGGFGEDLQQEATSQLSSGFGTQDDDHRRSFVRACIEAGRLQLLGAVADLGLPGHLNHQDICRIHSNATTDTGRWLDYLCSAEASGHTSDGVLSLPVHIAINDKSPAAHYLADLLVKHDPTHKSIASMSGAQGCASGYAIIMEAMMRATISTSSGSGPEVPAVSNVDGARRRRAAV